MCLSVLKRFKLKTFLGSAPIDEPQIEFFGFLLGNMHEMYHHLIEIYFIL